MKLLLDSHVFIWWIEDALPQAIRDACTDADNRVFISAASAWELQIKQDLGKLKLSLPIQALFDQQLSRNGLEFLPIKPEHIWALADLPRLHGDPFDRLLVAQARHEDLTLVSADAVMQGYPVEVLWT
ncbi:MAG: type II toxin-antitoxin system VapC family toxin [Thiobacillus sp.]